MMHNPLTYNPDFFPVHLTQFFAEASIRNFAQGLYIEAPRSGWKTSLIRWIQTYSFIDGGGI